MEENNYEEYRKSFKEKEIARILVILAVIAAVVFYLKGNNWF